MGTLYDRIFRPWQLRPKEYVFIWNCLVALDSYKQMNAYLANPPSGSFLPSFVFGRSWVSDQGVFETKLAVERLHQEFVTKYRGCDYGLWAMYFLFRAFERLTMYPLICKRDGEPARWYHVDKPADAWKSIEQQFHASACGKPNVVCDVQINAASEYGVSLVWDSWCFDRTCTLERMGKPDFR